MPRGYPVRLSASRVILPRAASVPLADPNQFAIVAFDPGGTIGWARLILDARAFSRPEHKALANLLSWDCGEFSGQEEAQCDEAVALIRGTRFPHKSEYVRKMNVLGEGFELTQLIGGDNLLSPVRINAVLAWESRKLALRYEIQKRALRTSVTPERLNLFGFQGKWTLRGKGKDEFAAMQHAVVWLRRVKKLSLSRPWKLSDGVSSNAYWDCACASRKRMGVSAMKCDLSHP